MIVYGDANISTGLILSSSTNTFRGVINGIDLTIAGTSDTPVTVTCASSNLDVKVSLQMFVENYNNFREQLNELTRYEVTATGIRGDVLWNCPVARAFDRDVARMLLETVNGIPGVRTLADLGITMRSNLHDEGHNRETGKLHFDEDKFEEAWRRDQDAVQQFFFNEKETTDRNGNVTTTNTGWAHRFSAMADSLVGSAESTGKVPARVDTLTMTIDRNDQRIDFMNERLMFKRQMYLKQFYAMEQAMARMSSDMAAVGNIANAWQTSFNSGN
jgi:flagellar hook-associated protein 2